LPPQETSEYPIKDKKHRKRITDVWAKVFDLIQESHFYDDSVVPVSIHWLVALSTSEVRALRHTATYLLLKLLTKCCQIAAKVNASLGVAAKQGNRTPKGDKATELAERQAFLKAQMETIHVR